MLWILESHRKSLDRRRTTRDFILRIPVTPRSRRTKTSMDGAGHLPAQPVSEWKRPSPPQPIHLPESFRFRNDSSPAAAIRIVDLPLTRLVRAIHKPDFHSAAMDYSSITLNCARHQSLCPISVKT